MTQFFFFFQIVKQFHDYGGEKWDHIIIFSCTFFKNYFAFKNKIIIHFKNKTYI